MYQTIEKIMKERNLYDEKNIILLKYLKRHFHLNTLKYNLDYFENILHFNDCPIQYGCKCKNFKPKSKNLEKLLKNQDCVNCKHFLQGNLNFLYKNYCLNPNHDFEEYYELLKKLRSEKP